MTGAPEKDEAAPYYFRYIDRVVTDDIVGFLQTQLAGAEALLGGISEKKSLHRYVPEKWSIRQVLNHVTDTERIFLSRALWFARGFQDPLPSFEQDIAAAGAAADECSWSNHVEEFRAVRLASHAFFRNYAGGRLDARGGGQREQVHRSSHRLDRCRSLFAPRLDPSRTLPAIAHGAEKGELPGPDTRPRL